MKEQLQQQRARYMRGELTHRQYYAWLCDAIGVHERMVPVSEKRLRASTDEHLNDITLSTWDRCDPVVRRLAYAKGLPWSLCDTVCCLKEKARQILDRAPANAA